MKEEHVAGRRRLSATTRTVCPLGTGHAGGSLSAICVLALEEPVCWCEPLDCWFITRYDDVSSALRDARISSSRIKPW